MKRPHSSVMYASHAMYFGALHHACFSRQFAGLFHAYSNSLTLEHKLCVHVLPRSLFTVIYLVLGTKCTLDPFVFNWE